MCDLLIEIARSVSTSKEVKRGRVTLDLHNGDVFYYVERGALVQVPLTGSGGKEHAFFRLPGEFIGSESIYPTKTKFLAEVKSLGDARLSVINKDRFIRALEKESSQGNHKLWESLVSYISNDLQERAEDTHGFRSPELPAEERLLAVLERLKGPIGEPFHGGYKVRCDTRTMGALIGLCPERTRDAIRRLRRQGKISSDGPGVFIVWEP